MPATTHRTHRKAGPAPIRRRVSYASEPRKVLLAVDGSRASNAATRLARRMAQLNLWSPQAITVSEPLPTYVGEFVLPAPPEAQVVVEHNVLLGLKTQLQRHGLKSWPAKVRFGPTGWSILESAHDMQAELIVIGLGKHGRLARLFGAETANRLARKSDIPVLAVHAGMRGLPRRIVAALDFGNASTRSLIEAVELAEPGAEVHLVHVMSPYNYTPIADGAWKHSYASAVEKGFEQIQALLPPAVKIRTKMLTGDVADEVVKYAKAVHGDLITAGSHNQGFIERVLLGSAPADLLRTAPCSVLITPPSAAGA